MEKIIATSFDGVLCADAYPKIGEPNFDMINELIYRRKNGDKLILWTCRQGIYLAQAVKWCKNKGLEFDAVNKNLPESIETYNGDTRKVFADIYIDDKNDYMAHLDKNAEFGDPLMEKEWDKTDYKFHDNGYERVFPKAATFSYEKYVIKNDYIHRIDIFVNNDGTYHIYSYQKSKNNNAFTYSVRLCDWQIELIKLKVAQYYKSISGTDQKKRLVNLSILLQKFKLTENRLFKSTRRIKCQKKKITIGTKVKFHPLPSENNFGSYEVIGTVVQIHKKHHWFRIKWGKNTPIYTCRHFSDVGESVILA